ncbi:uncharacterized protein LOC130904006 [Diorhabda carinulata]|uniref:uncharacterized protein LOC130904006 n=1 Tax=Diorhabda carinulata TaxID=1163345 RepID=UPI0025A068FD|nr:uncharacterized protein LOC130904006 [Diorhabda carinulata]
MMTLQLLRLLQLIVILHTTETFSYSLPIYGTKRYGRSNQHTSVSSYDPYSSYQSVVPHHYPEPINYYKMYPYSDSYHSSYYYPQQSYPLPYYVPSKYKIYQPVFPYYYQEHWPSQSYAAYYDYNDPDEVFQGMEREDREENQPIGHESYYEDASDDSNMDDVNAAFLQNLILTQMYQDSLNNKPHTDNYDDYDEAFAKIEEMNRRPTHTPEDETVRELKQLQKVNRERENKKPRNNNIHWAQSNQDNKRQRKNRQRKQKIEKQEEKRSKFTPNELLVPTEDTAIYSERKPIVKMIPTTQASTATTQSIAQTGQKEEFQMRPATPVRHAFAAPLLTMMSRSNEERKRTPSVYDTIKHLLDMEKSFELNQQNSDLRPAMKKRIITSEESLTRQLSVLKKAQ